MLLWKSQARQVIALHVCLEDKINISVTTVQLYDTDTVESDFSLVDNVDNIYTFP